jgi:hypothetical protein
MIVACVRTGTKYGPEYVERLVRGVKRHSSVECSFMCLTDQPETWPGVENLSVELSGWWAKMALFNPDWRGNERLVYLDLDTVVNGNIDPLLALETEFAICHSFTPAHLKRPCKYSSCIIALAPNYGRRIYDEFMANKSALIPMYVRYGDQRVMEHIDDSARSLQDMLPQGFFSYCRDGFQKNASLLIFGAEAKPHNSRDHWVKQAWLA